MESHFFLNKNVLGHTHKNLCKFELAKCRRISRGLVAPEIAKTGECERFLGNAVRKTQSIIPATTTTTSIPYNKKSWNYGTFAPPSSISFIDTTSSPVDIDSYGFGPASPTYKNPVESTTTKTVTINITYF